jgi:hypothetical protein
MHTSTGTFASGTDVPPERSRAEIEMVLGRYGATRFGYMVGPDAAEIAFEAHGRRVRFVLPMPDRMDARFRKEPTRGRMRPESVAAAAHQQEVRRRWRALCLAVKAKLEAVATGIASFEEEFLAHIVLPNGDTVGRWLVPQIAQTYAQGKMPPLLLGAGAPEPKQVYQVEGAVHGTTPDGQVVDGEIAEG